MAMESLDVIIQNLVDKALSSLELKQMIEGMVRIKLESAIRNAVDQVIEGDQEATLKALFGPHITLTINKEGSTINKIDGILDDIDTSAIVSQAESLNISACSSNISSDTKKITMMSHPFPPKSPKSIAAADDLHNSTGEEIPMDCIHNTKTLYLKDQQSPSAVNEPETLKTGTSATACNVDIPSTTMKATMTSYPFPPTSPESVSANNILWDSIGKDSPINSNKKAKKFGTQTIKRNKYQSGKDEKAPGYSGRARTSECEPSKYSGHNGSSKGCKAQTKPKIQHFATSEDFLKSIDTKKHAAQG